MTVHLIDLVAKVVEVFLTHCQSCIQAHCVTKLVLKVDLREHLAVVGNFLHQLNQPNKP